MNKFLKIMAIVLVAICFFSNVYALDFLNEVFNQANNFTTAPSTNTAATNNVGGALSNIIKGTSGTGLNLVGVIFDIGNLVIFAVTIALGLKYIYSGVEGKADIKSSLPNYVLGIVFFYSAQAVYNISSGFMQAGIGGNFDKLENNIFATINIIANTCAILGIVLVGLKYMLSPADTKADVKKQLIPVVIGIILVYCSYNVIMLVYNFGSAMLQ